MRYGRLGSVDTRGDWGVKGSGCNEQVEDPGLSMGEL